MRNVVPARALARRSRRWLISSVLIVLFGGLAISIGLFMRTVPLVVRSNPNYSLYVLTRDMTTGIGVALVAVAIILAIRALTWRQDNKLALATADALEEFLDDRFIFVRNVSKFSLGYIDALLIGPPGLLVFRITQRSGVYFNEGARWSRQRDKGDWAVLRWSPTKEAVRDIKKLREFLAARNLIDVPVFGVIVFLEEPPATRITTDNAVVPVVQPQDLQHRLPQYFGKDRIDQVQVNQVFRQLT